MRLHRAVVALLLGLLVATSAGCGGNEEAGGPALPSSSPSATLTGPGLDPEANFAVGDEFAQALADGSADALADAIALAAPGSVAARYLDRAKGRAQGDAERTVTKVSEGRYRLCAGASCEVLSDLVLADGKISSFRIDGRVVR